jgi:CRP/FNR family transcriptional regulator
MLSGADFLEPLSSEELEKLAGRCPDIHYREGEILSTPGEEGNRYFYIVKQGRVRVYELGPEGDEHTLALIRDGTAFAAQRLEGAYAQAVEPTILVVLDREDMKRLIESNPEVGMHFIEALIKGLRASERRFADMALKEVPARLANLVLELLEAEGVVTAEGYKIPTRYTQERLGTMIGAKRVAVSRAFKTLKEDAGVELRDRYIHVRDMEALRRFATAERGE